MHQVDNLCSCISLTRSSETSTLISGSKGIESCMQHPFQVRSVILISHDLLLSRVDVCGMMPLVVAL